MVDSGPPVLIDGLTKRLGRVGALVDGPGFAPHLSGRENLRLAWRMTRTRDGAADFDRSIAIAGLEEAVDRPYQTYSHGMRYRLGLAQALLAAIASLTFRMCAGSRPVVGSSNSSSSGAPPPAGASREGRCRGRVLDRGGAPRHRRLTRPRQHPGLHSKLSPSLPVTDRGTTLWTGFFTNPVQTNGIAHVLAVQAVYTALFLGAAAFHFSRSDVLT